MYVLTTYTGNAGSSVTLYAFMQAMIEFLETCMRHKTEMVIFEAARAVCNLPSASVRELGPAITMLHMFLASPKPSLRFAAVRTLHRLAAVHPVVVSKCNDDLETLISDSNRTIATLAITTLLKTGAEAGVDRLIKQIGTFITDVGSDELKVTVIQAIHELALRMPAKNRAIMTFLSNSLREEGGFEFKKAVLDGLLDIMEVIPESQAEVRAHTHHLATCSPLLVLIHPISSAGSVAPVRVH
jgi:coatomer protein complex subunit gamma